MTGLLLTMMAMVLPVGQADAHAINYALDKAGAGAVGWYYFTLGLEHIIPTGLDHILFIIALCLLNTRVKTIIWQATAFTLAHSITLALSLKNVIHLPSEIVEPIIALSIVFIAIENLLFRELHAWRVLIVFVFGLVHGLGFAASLNEIGLPPNKFLLSILFFNIGVELGQLIVILLVYFTLIRPFGKKSYYYKRIVFPISIAIALVAAYWTVERVFLDS